MSIASKDEEDEKDDSQLPSNVPDADIPLIRRLIAAMMDGSAYGLFLQRHLAVAMKYVDGKSQETVRPRLRALPVPLFLGTVVGYLAGHPFYYRIQPDKIDGQQGPDVHAENPLHNRILPLRRRVAYILDEHSGPSNAPGLVMIVCIWGF